MKREEAIERIKSRYDKWALDDKDLEAIQCTFPELTETEDEKIIEGFYTLIRGIRRDGGLTLNKVPLDKCETWLEKQKEKKLTEDWKETRKKECPFRKEDSCKRYADVVCECTGNCSWVVDYPKLKEIQDRKEQKLDIELIQRSWYMEGYHDREFNMEPKWTVKAEKGGPRYYENPNYGKPLEQKEQKPVDLVAELKLHLANTPKEQLEKEWKELEPYGNIGPTVHEFLYGEQPAEWSEEDENMLNSCISSIEEAKENRYYYRETDGDTSYDHEISWLKSLRPSWKPSEEQMSDYKVGDKISWEGKEYTIDKVVCGDDRFEIIDKAKKHLLETTNIQSSPEEIAVLDSFLFRCWQMGWLKKYETDKDNPD